MDTAITFLILARTQVGHKFKHVLKREPISQNRFLPYEIIYVSMTSCRSVHLSPINVLAKLTLVLGINIRGILLESLVLRFLRGREMQ